MKAAVIHSFGSADVIHIEDIATPSPEPGEVLVRVHAASVNPVDYKTRAGHYPPIKEAQLPITLGRDVAGSVERCGTPAGKFAPGEAVYALLDREHGGYAEYVIVKDQDLVKKPRRAN